MTFMNMQFSLSSTVETSHMTGCLQADWLRAAQHAGKLRRLGYREYSTCSCSSDPSWRTGTNRPQLALSKDVCKWVSECFYYVVELYSLISYEDVDIICQNFSRASNLIIFIVNE